MSSNAASSAAADQESAAEQAQQIQQQEHNQTVQLLSPYTNLGSNATNTLSALDNGNYSSFYNSPDYQFALSQGTQALDASAAAKGNLYSGGYGEALTNYGQGMASQQYNQYYNDIMGQAQLGEGAAGATGGANQSYANAAGSDLNSAGNAAASGTLGSTSAYNNMLNQLSGQAGNYFSSYGGSSMPSIPTSSYYGGSNDSSFYGNDLNMTAQPITVSGLTG